MNTETLGNRIRRERLAKEMTQRELAKKVGVGVPDISKIEAKLLRSLQPHCPTCEAIRTTGMVPGVWYRRPPW
jgi:transcriptional regulator with XRE-family HTH domain